MKLDFSISNDGLELKAGKSSFKIEYPEEVWQGLSKREKDFFLDNLAYLHTVCIPSVSGINKLKYNTAVPFFKNQIDFSVLKDIPSAVEENKFSTSEVIEKFKSSKFVFAGKSPKKPVFNFNPEEKAVIPFSSGKDSLLTFAVCSEIGLKPFPVYINDTVSPAENRLKLGAIRKICEKQGIGFGVITNSIENLNDFEYWKKGETDIGYSHLILSFCFLSMPFLKHCNAKYLILGNELDLDCKYKNKDGVTCYPSYDQSFEGTKRLNKIVKKASGGNAEVGSVISPLHDLAIMKILHKRYPHLGKFQSSCPGLDAVKEKRWCYKCSECVRFFVYMKALGFNPSRIGIKKNLFQKKYIKYHALFSPKERGRYDKAGGFEELKFAYYLAYKNGAGGYAINLAKRKFFDEIKGSEDRLYKKYFGIHSRKIIPPNIRKKVVSIYKEELGSF